MCTGLTEVGRSRFHGWGPAPHIKGALTAGFEEPEQLPGEPPGAASLPSETNSEKHELAFSKPLCFSLLLCRLGSLKGRTFSPLPSCLYMQYSAHVCSTETDKTVIELRRKKKGGGEHVVGQHSSSLLRDCDCVTDCFLSLLLPSLS